MNGESGHEEITVFKGGRKFANFRGTGAILIFLIVVFQASTLFVIFRGFDGQGEKFGLQLAESISFRDSIVSHDREMITFHERLEGVAKNVERLIRGELEEIKELKQLVYMILYDGNKKESNSRFYQVEE